MEADTYIKDETFDLFYEAVIQMYRSWRKNLCHLQLMCPSSSFLMLSETCNALAV